jgi:tRNA 5-methylaminomethyl-2-thiouridine biosynthesis bifunctional protein
VYFSREGGLAESEAVFLTGCGLPEAWKGKKRFSILELGFGTGVNFLAVWKAWRAHREPGAILHFASIEAFPLDVKDAARALEAFPEAKPLSDQLLVKWPARCRAPQRIWFEEDGLALTLYQDEAENVLPRIDGPFDAFFLDGFAPARNGAMWDDNVFRNLARLSAPSARAATFTVAGDVRRGLESAGFAIEKKPGFGRKRERLEARFTGAASSIKDALALYPQNQDAPPQRIAILGAGIAGAAMAHALRKRGAECVVLDAGTEIGAGASGNPAGLVMPRLDRGGALAEFFIAAYLYAVVEYEKLGADVWNACGVRERAEPRRSEAFADLLNDPPLPPGWMKSAEKTALHLRAGVLNPKRVIAAWLSNVQVLFDAPIAGLKQSGEGWLLIAPDGKARLKADAVVLACGAALKDLDVAGFLPLTNVKGQIETGPLESGALTHALMQSSYAAPCKEGITFGATFDREGVLSETEARAQNLESLNRLARDLRVDQSKLLSRASYRATLPDFAPAAGLMPHAEDWLAAQSELVNGRADYAAPPPALRNLYILGGLGARGLTLSPLLAEDIAAEMHGEPRILQRQARALLHPARFLHRMAKVGLTLSDISHAQHKATDFKFASD